ncbi:MAG: hypothetical protein M1490_04475 [Candidatus Bathyarchaeota archaeon]|nr:hypothetical protein [Candidatus Bathyarchaeota archaeon]
MFANNFLKIRLGSISSKTKKWHLLIKTLPILVVILFSKLAFHYFGLEVVGLNALFTSIIAATTFLLGFLISGVISDYRESERIPGDMAASLETIYDESYILNKNKACKATNDFIVYYNDFLKSLIDWFYRKEKTRDIIRKLHQMNDYFSDFENIMNASFLSQLKNEQSNLRKTIIRTDNIRDLSFIQSAYAIVEVLAFVVVLGLLIIKIEPFYEALFFTVAVSFLVIYMVILIKDLDNPFDYANHGEKGTEVSLKPIHDLIIRINEDKKWQTLII